MTVLKKNIHRKKVGNMVDVRRGTTFVRDLSHDSDRYLHAKDAFPTEQNKLRIIPLGGSEEIGGRNMTVLEYGQDIILVDIGLKFPEEDQPGIDYLIPNPTYLKGKEKRIRGVFITHGHMDHIGGVPQVMSMIGNPPIYGAPLTMALIQKRHMDNPTLPPLNAHVINHEDPMKFGCFEVTFLHINHSIPDSRALYIKTPEGNIFHTGDFKFDHSPLGEKVADIGKFARLGNEGIMLLMSDSTGSMKKGHGLSETTIQGNIDSIFKQAKGKVIAATFSSLLNRIHQVIKISEEYGRKVAIEGYSMRTNVQIARELGYFKLNPRTIISPQEAIKLPPEKLTIICTGAQGESNAALMRIANREHRFFRVEKGDTVIFSSSVIPGNESSVQGLKDIIARQKANIIHYQMMDIHAGGHAPKEDLKFLLTLMKPKFLMPIYGDFSALKAHADIALEYGMKQDQILLSDNGRVLELSNGEARVTRNKVPSYDMMVDGLGVGDLRDVVIRDRQLMSQDGMITVIGLVKAYEGKLVQAPEIISKGFVYMKSSGKLIGEIQQKVTEIIERKCLPGSGFNDEYVKKAITDELGAYLYAKTKRRPMILPVVVAV
jgi:ribonuclease J